MGTDALMDGQITATYADLSRRLAAVRRRRTGAHAAQGALLSVAVIVALALAALGLEAVLYLPVNLRTAIVWLLLAAAAGILLWKAGIPLLRLLGLVREDPEEQTAVLVGAAFPSVRDRLVNLLHLHREWERSRDRGPALYSTDLIDAAAEDVARETRGLDFTSIVGYASVRRTGIALALALCAALLAFLLFPSGFSGSAYRLAHYRTAFAAPLPFRLLVEPGTREIVKGDSVLITVRAEGDRPAEILLRERPEGQVNFEEHRLSPAPGGSFQMLLPAVKSSLEYYAAAGPVRSDTYRLLVTDRPVVRSLRLTLRFPVYARLPARELDDNVGDVTALRGTSIGIAVESSKPLAAAALVLSDSTRAPLRVDGARATGNLLLRKEQTYHVQLSDREGTRNADPIEYTLRITPDAYPTVAIVAPGTNVDVTDNTALPLVLAIRDDFGFSRLRLAYRLVHSRYEAPAAEMSYLEIPLPEGTGAEAVFPFTWALEGLHLVPEDVISYLAEVYDNDNVSGPKRSTSETFLLRMPSLTEVFAGVDRAHESSMENLQQALQQTEQAKKALEDLRQDLKKNDQKLDWQDKKKAEEVARRYEDAQKRLEEVRKTVDTMVQEMQKNRILSPETMEKYQQLQQLMEEMNTPELADALKKLQQAVQQMSPEAIRQALQQFQFSEENFRKSIERTMSLLKRIQVEQKVDEAARRAQDLLTRQQELARKTDSLAARGEPPPQALPQEQRDLQKQAEELRRQLAELQKKMEELAGEMPLKQMEQVTREMDQSRLSEQMQEIARQMQAQQLQQASQGQQQALRSMSSLAQQLGQMKQAMQAGQMQQVMKEMRRTVQDLLELSRRQEALKNESRQLEQNSPRFRENAQRQMELLHDAAGVAERMSGLSQKSFAVSPEMGKAIGDAMRSMGEATQSLEQRNGGAAEQQQGAAMGSLNEGAALMQSTMNALAQGGGQGMGMAGLMQRLQQMAGRQQGINQGTQQMGGLTPAQAAAMSRLAAEQGAVRKSLDELAREAANAGDLRRLLGDMNRIAQEMREVQTDLAQGSVTPETLQKQQRILSRLLDASRSARERDYEKTRKAETGTNIARTGPGAIDLSTQEGRSRLQRDLLRALEEGYARDYEALIRKYFEALEAQPDAR